MRHRARPAATGHQYPLRRSLPAADAGALQGNPVSPPPLHNAGPNKVTQWLPTGESVPADVWAETIPYRETRIYVQRVIGIRRRLPPSTGLDGDSATTPAALG